MRVTFTELRELLYSEGLSPATVRSYLQAVRGAARYFAERPGDLDTCTATQLAAYRETLPHSHASRKMARCGLAAYWRVTGRDDPPIRALRVPREAPPLCMALDPPDARRLYLVARQWDAHAEGPEGLATLLGLRLALRRAEIATLRWDGVDDDEGWLQVVGKGDKRRRVPLHPEVAAGLARWRTARRPDPADPRTRPGEVWVFAGKKGGHVTPTTVWTWVKRVAARAGVEPLKPHWLRHTALAEMNDRTGDLRTAQAIAGHSRPETTARYTRATSRRMREAIAAVDYLSPELDDGGAWSRARALEEAHALEDLADREQLLEDLDDEREAS